MAFVNEMSDPDCKSVPIPTSADLLLGLVIVSATVAGTWCCTGISAVAAVLLSLYLARIVAMSSAKLLVKDSAAVPEGALTAMATALTFSTEF